METFFVLTGLAIVALLLALLIAVVYNTNSRRRVISKATGRILMGINEQKAQLETAIGELKTAVSAVGERIALKLTDLEDKLRAAGEVDPDLQSSIDEVRLETSRLSALAAEPAPGEPVAGEASPGGFVESTETSTDKG